MYDNYTIGPNFTQIRMLSNAGRAGARSPTLKFFHLMSMTMYLLVMFNDVIIISQDMLGYLDILV